MKPATSTPATPVERPWHVLDATSAPFGRIATQAAVFLMGKHRPAFASNVDGGDFVVIVNAEKLISTCVKMADKVRYRYSGYPGSLRGRTLEEQVIRKPEEAFRNAIKGMLPKNRLQSARLSRLKIYTGSEHPHVGQLSS